MLRFLPDDINIEDVLSYLPEDAYKISIDGLHKRNSYKDIIGHEETLDGKIEFHVGRNSLYNSLPEYMFHPINRFENIPEHERKERFAKEYARQEREKENAHRFFAPIDILLLNLKAKVKDEINLFASSNIIMQKIIGDTLTDEERNNRFIKRVVPFLPNCKRIRGNRTLITLLLRKVLSEEEITLERESLKYMIMDNEPQYNETIENYELETLYLGNEFGENITTYTIHYWSDDECNENFTIFLDELQCFKRFFQDYFLSVEEVLSFNIVKDAPPLRLSDNESYNYLNYNTNI